MLIFGQLCGRLSTVQMVFVGVGWVVVGCRGGCGGVGLVVGGYPLLLPSSSYDLLLGCCEHWGRSSLIEER